MISSKIERNIAIASLTEKSKLNILNAEEVKNALTLLLRDYNQLVFNMDGVIFIDSTGFGTLVTIFKRARENDKIFKICGVSPEAMELIKITKLDKVFDIHPDEATCLQSFEN
ncbi:MAG: STAS domain-containing protein [Salinivirgaceae bacterium]